MEFNQTGAPATLSLAWLEPAGGQPRAIEAPCSLGRCASNHVVLAGERVSRKHALIYARDSVEFWLADLSSTNGTYLNNHRLTQTARLYDRDQIGIGPHRLTFRLLSGPRRPEADEGPAEATFCEAAAEYGWLLSVQLDSPTRVAVSLVPEEVPTILGRWQDDCKEVVERHGGKLMEYLTDGSLAFWHDRRADRTAIAHAVSELSRLQVRSQPPFYLLLHYGQVNVDRAGPGPEENLSGPAVNFVFRARKLATSLKSPILISEVARALLQPYLSLREAGQHRLNGFEGEHRFFRV